MSLIRSILADTHGTAALEMLMVVPLMVGMTLAGVELTNNIITQKKVASLAQMVADNASRAGDSTALGLMPLRESDVNDVLDGAALQAKGLDLQRKGRIILSSLEQNAATGQQTIRWRRCAGGAAAGSAYANVSNKPTKDPRGIEMRGKWVSAPRTDAVMVVEVYYDYQPIFPLPVIGYDTQQFSTQAVRLVRDNRDLSSIKSNASASRCTSSTTPGSGTGSDDNEDD